GRGGSVRGGVAADPAGPPPLRLGLAARHGGVPGRGGGAAATAGRGQGRACRTRPVARPPARRVGRAVLRGRVRRHHRGAVLLAGRGGHVGGGVVGCRGDLRRLDG